MSNIYYSNIFGSIDSGEESFKLIKNAVTPYEVFVKNAITSLQKKQNIKAKWKKIGGEVVQLQLVNQEYFYKVSPIYEVQIISSTFEKGEFEIISEENPLIDSLDTLFFKSKTDRKKEEVTPKFRTERGKQIVKINLTDYSYINNSNNYSIDSDFESIEIRPLWLEKEVMNINSIIQEDKILDFKILENGNVRIFGLNKNLPLYVDNENTKFKLINDLNMKSLENYKTLNESGELYIISSEKPTFDHLNIYEENPRFPFERFTYKNTNLKGELLKINSVDSYESMKLVINPLDNLNELVLTYKGLDFTMKKISKFNDNELYRIQLEEINEGNDDVITSSPLEHFFEDGVEIYEKDGDQKRFFEIVPRSSNSSEFSFILKEKLKSFSNKITPVFPKEGGYLELSLNTYQLEKQLEALNIFINKPLEEQKPLLNLFKPIRNVQWPEFEIQKLQEHEWLVLKDSSRSGTENQRSFVEKAMSTTDFMLLEGPPGSGKTTAILELICQLIKTNKRVLLCGSTHVAIDNVLERLKEMEFFKNVLPVRIGDENRVSDSVREFQIDNLIQSSNLEKQLILDSANLVCGTTLGILQHPNFKTQKEQQKYTPYGTKIRDKSIYPEFDYLIIDESSKTTFNEFLIPALFAKKWILVGDVKQLSPFTDREIIESNIRNLMIDNRNQLSESLQDMCFLIKELCMDPKKSRFKFLTVVTSTEIPYLIKEVNFRNFPNRKYLIIDNNLDNKQQLTSENFDIKSSDEVKETALYFSYEYSGIFINNSLLKELEDYIPVDFLLIRNAKNNLNSLEFRQNHEKDYLETYIYEDRGRQKLIGLDIPRSINNYLNEKDWASEITWRMIRNFELKTLSGKKADIANNLLRDIDNLLPISKDRNEVDNSLFILKQVALPSILESLQRGIDKKEIYHKTTTLTEGFTKVRQNSVNNRFVTLNYQHRMHPDISQLPRELFYNNEALNDAVGLNREWGYDRYPARSIWIDHNRHKTTKASFNLDEVKIIKRELEAFRKWKINNDDSVASIGVITFYRRQEEELRKMLREYCSEHSIKSQNQKMSQFSLEHNGKKIIEIKLYTVDKFQGQEADLIFLSMVQTNKDGFMDNPNRLNVAITRARYQMVYVGMHKYYYERSNSDELRKIATKTQKFKGDIYDNQRY